MTDKNRIQRENAVAEALLGSGSTARNLMRLLINSYESGCGINLELWPLGGEKVCAYFVHPRDITAPPQPADALHAE